MDDIYLLILIIIILIIIVIIIIIILYHNNSLPGAIVELNDTNKNELNTKLKLFEKRLKHDYPMGNDYFNIEHGDDYFKFFDRLGKVHMMTLINNDEIVGSGCGVLRNINYFSSKSSKDNSNGNNQLPSDYCWYLCDLKIDPKYRGLHVPFKMGLLAKQKLNISNRVYGITMNKNGENNKVVKLVKRIPFLNFKSEGKLMIYSIDYDVLLKIRVIIEKYRGPITFLSLLNIKDLILKSTGLPMPLLHIQWRNDFGFKDPLPNHTYMFCCPINDPMYNELTNNNIITDTTADIVHYNMDDSDWKFVLTSDI